VWGGDQFMFNLGSVSLGIQPVVVSGAGNTQLPITVFLETDYGLEWALSAIAACIRPPDHHPPLLDDILASSAESFVFPVFCHTLRQIQFGTEDL
jgi:hypothetical protein